MAKQVNKKVSMKLEGEDGNAFNLMGKFAEQAKKEGWEQEEIDAVLHKAQLGDYDNLIRTLMEHIQD